MNKTIPFKIFIIALTLLLPTYTAYSEISKINGKIRHLLPSAFPNLPKDIRNVLKSRGCAIPQAYDNIRPHNVIHGEFIKKGQKDWAVLCSKEKISTILIFEGISHSKVTELASSPNENWLQTFADGQYGFSREIMVAGKKQIMQYNENLKELAGEEQDLPPIIHDGIDDIFVNKASVVHYYHQGQWLELAGSD